MLSLNGTNPSAWTRYEFNYTAIHSSPIIVFSFKTNNNFNYYLDDIYVVDNSSTIATGWTQWCTYKFNEQSGMITSRGYCYTSSNTGIDFIGQAFNANIADTYTISCRLILIGFGKNTNNAFYADII